MSAVFERICFGLLFLAAGVGFIPTVEAHPPFRAGGGGGRGVGGGGLGGGSSFQNYRTNFFHRSGGFGGGRFYGGFYGSGGYGYGNNYVYNPYVNVVDPYGGYLRGAADVINSQGQYLMTLQQAYMLNEDLKQKQLDTRRETYEEWLWERSHLPTLNDERERIQKEELRRSLNDPPLTEIWSGKALNDILTNLETLYGRGLEGPAVPLDPDMLKNINVSTGKGPVNIGLLKESKLRWPLGLINLPPTKETAEVRTQIENLLTEGKKQALNGKLDANLVNELDRCVTKLSHGLVANVGEYGFSDYTEAKRYVRQLQDAVQLLKQPDAANFLSGKYAAKGSTVKELVDYLRENGLRFAPAINGEEASYTALHSAMVRYDLATAATSSVK